MKKLLLSVIALSAFTINANAQAIAKVLEPASIFGNKTFTWAEPASWGQTPDFNSPGVFVQDTLAMGEDGTPGTNAQGKPLSQEGCNAFINPAQVQGKIAVVYRGTCNFSLKALNAQNAGAVACIILNRDPEAIPMGAGTDAPNVTIPTVMLTSTDGANITTEMLSGVVRMFLGNKVGLNPNDLSTNGDVARISNFGGVSSMYQNPSFTPAIEIYNLGSANQAAASVKATITGPSGSVYDQTAGPFAMAAGDTVFIQTGNPQSFPAFSLASYPEGEYTLTYTLQLGANSDDDPSDNTVTSSFRINPNMVALSHLNATNNPTANTYPSNSPGIYDACMTLRMPNSLPAGRGVNQIQFYPEGDTAVFDITGSEILFKIFEWSDSSVIDNSTIVEVYNESYYIPNKAATRQLATVNLSPGYALTGGQLYLVCLETADGTNIAFGYDNSINYSGNSAITGLVTSPVQVNNAGADTWFRGGWSGTSALSLGLNMDQIGGIEEGNNLSAQVFPNPANDVVTVRVNATGSAKIIVADISGKVVANNTVNLVNGAANLATDKLEAGMYIFNITLENGQTTKVNVVKK